MLAVPIGLGLAIFLNQTIFGIKLIKSLFFFPFVIVATPLTTTQCSDLFKCFCRDIFSPGRINNFFRKQDDFFKYVGPNC